MEDLDVNTLVWGMFMTVAQQAAVHLGNEYLENLQSTKHQPQRTVIQLFDVTKKLVSEQTPDRLARNFLEKDDSVE